MAFVSKTCDSQKIHDRFLIFCKKCIFQLTTQLLTFKLLTFETKSQNETRSRMGSFRREHPTVYLRDHTNPQRNLHWDISVMDYPYRWNERAIQRSDAISLRNRVTRPTRWRAAENARRDDGKFVATATSNTNDVRLFGDGAGLVNTGEQEQDEMPRAGIFPALTRAEWHRELSFDLFRLGHCLHFRRKWDGRRGKKNRCGKDRCSRMRRERRTRKDR